MHRDGTHDPRHDFLIDRLVSPHWRHLNWRLALLFGAGGLAIVYYVTRLLEDTLVKGCVTTVCMGVLAAILTLYALMARQAPRQLQPGEHFDPAKDTGAARRPGPDPNSSEPVVFPREQLVASVVERLKVACSRRKAIVLVGRSGSGKSFLASQLLPRQLPHSMAPALVRGFTVQEAFESDIDSRLDEAAATGRDTLLVLDQFEEFVQRATSSERQCLTDRLRDCLRRRVVPLIVIREEAYFGLRFLGDLIDFRELTVDVGGLGPDAETRDWNLAVGRLADVCPDGDLRTAILSDLGVGQHGNVLLPLELQVVGYVLEDLQRQQHGALTVNTYEKAYGRKKGLLARYFQMNIEATDDPSTARAVLYALSSGRTSAQQYDVRELCFITHRRGASIEACLKKLMPRLVQERGGSRFSMSHDFYAEQYQRLSGMLIESEQDRDNMDYFSDLVRRPGWDREQFTQLDSAFKVGWADGVFILAMLLLVLRLFSPKLPQDLVAGLRWSDRLDTDRVLSTLYLPAFIMSTLSGFYVWRVFKLVMRPSRCFGLLGAVWYVASMMAVVAGTVYYRSWMVLMGGAGFLLGCLILAASGRRQLQWRMLRLPRSDALFRTGSITAINMGLVSLLGYVVACWLPVWESNKIELYKLDLQLATGAAIAMAFLAVRTHASVSRAPVLVSALERQRIT